MAVSSVGHDRAGGIPHGFEDGPREGLSRCGQCRGERQDLLFCMSNRRSYPVSRIINPIKKAVSGMAGERQLSRSASFRAVPVAQRLLQCSAQGSGGEPQGEAASAAADRGAPGASRYGCEPAAGCGAVVAAFAPGSP